MLAAMITPRQIRAARALLDWSQQDLADTAIVSLNALARLERGTVDPRASTLLAVEKALMRAGIEFIPETDRGEGVRLAAPEPASHSATKVASRKRPLTRRVR
jgi:transcriptional regulator with XRE-family HTH domain